MAEPLGFAALMVTGWAAAAVIAAALVGRAVRIADLRAARPRPIR